MPPIIYTSNWDREGHTRVLFPFYGGRENYREGSSVHIFPPLALWATKWKNPDGHSFGWMPFIYYRKRGPERILAIPPLLTGFRRDAVKDETVASILLFGYYSRKKDDVWRVFAPLFFDHETATTRTTQHCYPQNPKEFEGPFGHLPAQVALWQHLRPLRRVRVLRL